MQPYSPKNKGFTLVELSIVLVIIGLIVGGIFTGENLIRIATLRATAKDLEKYKSAYYTFKDKYECVPGDCVNATDYFGTQGGALVNGNGNGKIDYGPEVNLAGWELVLAGLINPVVWGNGALGGGFFQFRLDPGGSLAYFNNGDVYGAIANNKNNFTVAANCSPWIFCPSIKPQDAYALDKKLDDGLPQSGSFLATDAVDPTGSFYYDCLIQVNGVWVYNSADIIACRIFYVIE